MIGIYLILASIIVIAFYINNNKVVTFVLLGMFTVLQWGLNLYAYANHQQSELGYFTFDALGILLLGTLSIIAIPAFVHSHIYLEDQPAPPAARSIFYASMVLLITAISAGYLANHIAVIWIFTELTTLCASALIYHHRNKLALEGTWKYVFVCAISITFVFIGILFLSLSLTHGQADDMSFQNLLLNSEHLNSFWLRLAFLFIFTGFTAKIGLVPMFTAGVDAKDKAPAPAGALLSSALMNLGFIGIFRTYAVVANTPLKHWAGMVIGISAILSVFVATVYMLKVKNIKRMLAYSSIEHMGLVMLAVAAGGVGYYAAILHVILHAFVKSSMFFQFTQLYRVYKNKSIYQTGNYFKYNTAGAVVLLLGFISATAMPPSGLFVSEFLIFKSLFAGGHFMLLAVVLLLLTIIIWAFGKNIFKILFIPPVGFDESLVPVISPWESLSQYLLLAAAVYIGLNPPTQMISLINDAIQMLPQ